MEKRPTDPLRAGRELSVDYVLDGRIKMVGNRVRVSLQLLDIQQGANSWAEQFDEQYSDALDLEDSISAKVAQSLLPQLTETGQLRFRKRGTDNSQAFDAYLRGRYFWNKFTPGSLPRALTAFEEAIKLDPNYALAHVGLADFYNWAAIYGILPPGVSTPQAKAAAKRAIELDDSLGEAYATYGLSIETADCNWEETERTYQRALELNPNYAVDPRMVFEPFDRDRQVRRGAARNLSGGGVGSAFVTRDDAGCLVLLSGPPF
jgi:tetratricopeptide (TPR) repeat protein